MGPEAAGLGVMVGPSHCRGRRLQRSPSRISSSFSRPIGRADWGRDLEFATVSGNLQLRSGPES